MDHYRAFVHDDGEYLSIGFDGTNDTLLKMPEGCHDRERVVAWVEAVNRARGAVAMLERIAADLERELEVGGRIPTVSPDEIRALLARLDSGLGGTA